MPTSKLVHCFAANFAAIFTLVHINDAYADALVVSKAMQSSTIAELYILEDHVRVEIEIGAADLKAFVNVLPDALHEKVIGEISPVAVRTATFLRSDWIVRADGELLPSKVVSVVPGKRVARDEVTGDPLIEQPDDAGSVLRLVVRHELKKRPRTLTLRPLLGENRVAASIGFVCYHKGLPVNDFRFLSQEVNLDLDWEDPWYSRFRHPNLRRQFDSPLSAFLYVEPYEVRKEVIIRPRDLENWIELDLPADGIIPVSQQPELKRRVSDFLSGKNHVMVDGRSVPGRLDRIHFVHRTLRTIGVIEPPIDLEVNSATLGVIFVYPVKQLPNEVSMRWELFSPKIQKVPAVSSDEAGGLPTQLTPSTPVLSWKNYLTNPTSNAMMTVSKPPPPRQWTIPCISLLGVCVVCSIVGWHWVKGLTPTRYILTAIILALGFSVVALPYARLPIVNRFADPIRLSTAEAKEITSRLLYNIYRSFDSHDETLVYDRLAMSTSGELLSQVYLETRKSMEVKNQGGLRVSVKQAVVTELEPAEVSARGSTFLCRWRVTGWIGHWGHVHHRVNEHSARITLHDQDGSWKITTLDMLDEVSTVDANPQTDAKDLQDSSSVQGSSSVQSYKDFQPS